MKFRSAYLLAPLAFAAGCTTEASPEDVFDPSAYEDVTAEFTVPLDPSSKASIATADPSGDTTVVSLPSIQLAEGQKLPDLSDYSESQLAEALKTVVLTGDGRLLREKAPASELARIAKQPSDVEQVFDGQSGLAAALEAADSKDAEHIFGSPGNIGTSDNRTIPSQAAPWNQIVHISSGCSGMYMGDRTLITAAHCVVANNGSRRSGLVVTPYRKGSGSGSSNAPYGQHTVASTSQIRVPAGYFTAQDAARDAGHIAPNGTVYDEGMMPFDFAVIEFAAGARPAPMAAVGWNGFAVNGFSSGTAKVYGYPGSGCPGSTIVPRLCGMDGSAYTNGVYLETDNIDVTGGQSGGPWLRSSNHMVGHYIAEVSYFDFARCGFSNCQRNVARRLDNTVWSWVQTSSPDW